MSFVLVHERDFDGAIAVTDKTVALAPYDTYMLSRLVMVLVQIGRPDQALKWADQVAARDRALGWSYNYGRGWAYLVLGRFGEAVDALTQTEFNDAHLLLAIAYVRLGRLANARGEVGKMLRINPTMTLHAWRLGYSFRDPAILDRYALDLVQSGLPETNSVDWPSSGTPPSKDSSLDDVWRLLGHTARAAEEQAKSMLWPMI